MLDIDEVVHEVTSSTRLSYGESAIVPDRASDSGRPDVDIRVSFILL